MADRLDTIRRLAAEHDADAALVTHGPDIAWTVGFTGSSGVLVVTANAAHLVTDGRYTTQAAEEVHDATVHIAPDALPAYIGASGLLGPAGPVRRVNPLGKPRPDLARPPGEPGPAGSPVGRVVVQGDRITVSQFERYQDACPGATFVSVAEWLSEARATKTEAEIDGVRRAQALTCSIFESVLPLVRPGVTESDLAAELVVRHLRAGASAMSFEPIVASGARGALPHARPTARPFETGDLVVIDVGCVLDGYCSDLTRTVAVGDPGEEARAAYKAVRSAHAEAIANVQAGVSGKELDGIARDVLDRAGFGAFFTHSLGHGVGLEVHEWPRLSSQVDHVLPAGATVTVEPGVYVPGRFGIRIEDVVAVREGRADNLTPLSTDLLVL